MKTTLDLDDHLLIEAKTLAARRQTTLKAIVEHALRREIQPSADLENPNPDLYQVGPFGILSLKRRGLGKTAEQVQALIDAQYGDEDARAITIAKGQS